ncbi:30S ribosomal protein S17 [Chlamydia sp. 17-3921]|uniref:30S ribosomal protein S17 n=1 Tax=Chlamydia sp. 17-3921 TaxID=2675798 RepID=UPI0019192BB3|nr:30S ribosomal protein S17 [Chlamydia sp. 17-3921]
MANLQRGSRKTKVGIVVSAKMDKTVVVRVERICSHPQYAKVVRDSKKFYAHNDLDGVSEGSKVKIQETRPLSKTKRWRVIECIN